MNKINNLLKKVETYLLDKPKNFVRATKFRDYLTKVLSSLEESHLRRDIEESINSWSAVSDSDKAAIRAIMKNVLNQALSEKAAAGSGANSRYKETLFLNLVVAKQIVTKLSRIIGVQPMHSPIGIVYFMSYKDTNPEEPVEEVDNSEEAVAARGFIQGTGGRKKTLELLSQAIESVTRRLQAAWSLEAFYDAKVMHGINIATEIERAMAAEITFECVSEVLHDLVRLADETDLSEKRFLSRFEKGENVAAEVVGSITAAANYIAASTQMGAGNFAIVPPAVVSILQSYEGTKFKPSGDAYESGEVFPVGKLHGTIDVYCSASMNLKDKILVGYKGATSTETGYVFSPYIPALSTGVTVNPVTYQPMMSLSTRYGKAIQNIEQSKAFYRVLKLDTPE